MSLYDEAVVALIAEGAAGKDGKLYNIKPEEKLKATELITDGSFNDESNWTVESGVSVTGGQAVFNGTAGNIDIYQDVSDLSGKTVKISFRVSEYVAGDLSGMFYDSSDAATDTASGNGNFSFIKTIGSGHNDNVGLRGTNSFEGKVDNLSVKEVEQKPLDFTFTRGSNLTATRVAPNGYIEKGRENLITYSNDFSEWSAGDGVSVNWNASTTGHSGYDGSTNAWTLDKATDANSYSAIPNPFAYTGVFTWSIYARNKSDKDNGIHLYTPAGQIKVDLTDGSRISGGHIDYNITPITGNSGDNDRWYRISFSASGSFTVADTPRIKVIDLNGDNDTGVIYVQDSQLEVGLVATDYIDSKSTTGKAGILEDSPRFDYLDVTCPHLLMEPTRKNLFQHSEYLAGSFNAIRATFEENNAKSPEGVENAVFIQETSDTNNTHGFQFIDFDIEDDEFYSLSFFVKAKGREKFFCQFSEDTVLKMNVTVDLSGTPSAVDNKPGHTGSEKIIDYGDGWYRVEINGKEGLADDATRNINFFFIESTDGTVTSYDGDTTKGLLFYGLQIEKNHFCTSYIPNHGKSGGETRNDDVTDTVDFGDYMDGEDVTWYVELAENETLIRDGATTGIRLSTTDLNASSVKFYRSYENLANGGIKTVIYFADDENDNDPASHQITEAGPVKVIVRRVKNTGEFTVFYDGAQKYQAFAPANYGRLKSLKIDGEKQPIFLNNMFLFDRALTDDECIALTT